MTIIHPTQSIVLSPAISRIDLLGVVGGAGGDPEPPLDDWLLLENGDAILLENEDELLLESA